MKRLKKRAFSLLEVIAAIVILAVVTAATFATVAPMRAKSDDRVTDQEITTLNALSQSYLLKEGSYPANLHELAEAGYLAHETQEDLHKLQRMNRSYRYAPSSGTFSKR